MTNDIQATAPAIANEAEWHALKNGAAMADFSRMGRLRITGADALDLLNRLTTNKLEALPPGTARGTVVTNGNGRVVDLLHLAALPDALLCLTSPGRAKTVIDWLDTYTFGEDITVEDITDATAQFALSGPDAAAVLAKAGVEAIAALEPDSVAQQAVARANVVVWRTLPGGSDGFFVIVDAATAGPVREGLLAAGAVSVSEATWDAYRIANGFPVYGAEFDESANPLEARLHGVISEDKGCYTGQEVIARLLTYRKVQRRLMSVDLSAAAAPGTPLTSGGDKAGTLTSTAVLPDGRCIGLALVPMKLAEPGATVDVGESGVTAVLREPAYALTTEPQEA
jgi:tRNA-modifying protein YgfZ